MAPSGDVSPDHVVAVLAVNPRAGGVDVGEFRDVRGAVCLYSVGRGIEEELGQRPEVGASHGVDDSIHACYKREIRSGIIDIRNDGDDCRGRGQPHLFEYRHIVLLSSAASCLPFAAERVWPYTTWPARTNACAIGRPMNPVAL
ncbi:hypothetical protein NUW54_g8863 [Trametes sanguinea]|uniref:Uncharacterized protein n=1 Tax=Trametes sanguinea TaxID=158606 RepID=A0ACC1PDB9_9APHY|nr:hypothetical protein NUW54_g8863 [Trametes sanguinea]